ncbi:hypothetical protein [Parapedobacter koreensis]|uniref:Uncharacterized protein n=1 Tax=Parapedobacter koreensis TaxID=332977 RepID=A0A1H7UQ92_9SPHI|nr:hypothetical protein [Parapedobacter koreensis]SEL98875.1 hypothetical protein SAMN05421740_1211 [Parapedobacter koreensis]
MRKALFGVILVWMIAVDTLRAQQERYIMLDMLDSTYQTFHYTLNTASLYGVKNAIELYNVYIDDGTLALFSILPDFNNRKSWDPLDIRSINDQIFSDGAFRSLIREKSIAALDYKKSMRYRLIKRENGKDYVSKTCLLEVFNIREYSDKFNAPFGTINTGQSKLTVREMKALHRRFFPNSHFPLELQYTGYSMEDRSLIAREYLSRELEINGDKAYQFWTFIDWGVADGWNVQRGIDRFVYIPGKGIVGGSFDFYFYFQAKLDDTPSKKRYTISPAQQQANIMDEKVMLYFPY